MSEHVELLRQICEPCSRDSDIADAAADHLEACERLLAAYYASHNDGKFGPCECGACQDYRKERVE